MKLSRRISELAAEPVADEREDRRAAIKLAAALCACRAQVAKLEAENSGQREAILALNRHEGHAKDLAATRAAEREACARVADELGFSIGAQRIRERK